MLKLIRENAGKVSHAIRELGSIEKEEWSSTSWLVMLTISAGLQTALYDKINSLTAGKAEVKILKRETI